MIRQRTDRWAEADRLAFDHPDRIPAASPLVRRLVDELVDTSIGSDQLVHGDLAGNVLLDATGAPVVIDVAPYWRPVRWAEAVCVLDAVVDLGAPVATMSRFAGGERTAGDAAGGTVPAAQRPRRPRPEAYERALSQVVS